MGNFNFKFNERLVLTALIVVMSLFFLYRMNQEGPASPSLVPEPVTRGSYISYSDAFARIEGGEVTRLYQQNNNSEVVIEGRDGVTQYTILSSAYATDLLAVARENNVRIDIRPARPPSMLASLLMLILPIGLLIGAMVWMQRRNEKKMESMTSGRNMTSSEKSSQMVDPANNPYRLKDVAGCDEAKKEVAEIVEFLKNPEMYARVGAKATKGVLMSGPPGTGKTLMAKAIAGEADVPFFSASGSDFMEMFVGVGPARIRSLFREAKEHAPSIIFIDEIDSIGRSRSNQGIGGGEGEREQTLNALLTEMDGFGSNHNVVVIAATNRSDILDEALRRPGRFDREVTMSLPDRAGRVDILKTHGQNVPIGLDVVWEDVAKGTPGFSGADLANLVNEAAILAAREKVDLITKKHFDEARDKIIMGVQRGPLTNQREREVVAYHEAGHAVVAKFLPLAAPVHKVSIIPRGRALGVTMQLPDEDSFNHSAEKLKVDMAILMGGRAAEDVVMQGMTVGASNDFMRATVIARRMIASWGMDPDFGPLSLDGERGNDWVGSDVWSEKTKEKADALIQGLIKERYNTAVTILKDNRDVLEAVAQELLSFETIDASRFEEIVNTVLAERESRQEN